MSFGKGICKLAGGNVEKERHGTAILGGAEDGSLEPTRKHGGEISERLARHKRLQHSWAN